jgi:2-acylglycerol O-acyltransferase 2
LLQGAVDAGRATAHKVLDAGLSAIVYPGGSAEIFTTEPSSGRGDDTTTFLLSNRKGFIKLALEHRVPIVPVVVYGE